MADLSVVMFAELGVVDLPTGGALTHVFLAPPIRSVEVMACVAGVVHALVQAVARALRAGRGDAVGAGAGVLRARGGSRPGMHVVRTALALLVVLLRVVLVQKRVRCAHHALFVRVVDKRVRRL